MEPRTPARPAHIDDTAAPSSRTPVMVTPIGVTTPLLATPIVLPSPCPVCLSPMVTAAEAVSPVSGTSHKPVFVTQCGHRFHLPCLGRWVATQCEDSCPNCRTALHSQTSETLRSFVPVGGLNTASNAVETEDGAAAARQQQHQLIVNRTSSAREAVRRRMLMMLQQPPQHTTALAQ